MKHKVESIVWYYDEKEYEVKEAKVLMYLKAEDAYVLAPVHTNAIILDSTDIFATKEEAIERVIPILELKAKQLNEQIQRLKKE